MKISCTPISARVAFESGKIDLAAYLELISEAGAEATDIMDINRYKWFLKDPEKELAALPELLKKNNLVIACYSAGNNFGWRDEDKFNENIQEGLCPTLHRANGTERRMHDHHRIPGRSHSLQLTENTFFRMDHNRILPL
jgi:hypothetical protein